MKLYLGAGQKRLPGYTHVDIQPEVGIDVPHDLNVRPWPFDDGSASAIVAEDLVEHLDISLIEFCEEAWRVLQPTGELFVRTPPSLGRQAVGLIQRIAGISTSSRSSTWIRRETGDAPTLTTLSESGRSFRWAFVAHRISTRS